MKRRPPSALARIDPEDAAFERVTALAVTIDEMMPKDHIDALRVLVLLSGFQARNAPPYDYRDWNRTKRAKVTTAAYRALKRDHPAATPDIWECAGKGMRIAYPTRTLLSALEAARRPDESLSDAIVRLAGEKPAPAAEPDVLSDPNYWHDEPIDDDGED